jgi:hypothetical protein
MRCNKKERERDQWPRRECQCEGKFESFNARKREREREKEKKKRGKKKMAKERDTNLVEGKEHAHLQDTLQYRGEREKAMVK